MGVGVAVTAVMLLVAYAPGYFPEGYERLHRYGWVHIVPLFAATQILATVGWLYISSKDNQGDCND